MDEAKQNLDGQRDRQMDKDSLREKLYKIKHFCVHKYRDNVSKRYESRVRKV